MRNFYFSNQNDKSIINKLFKFKIFMIKYFIGQERIFLN